MLALVLLLCSLTAQAADFQPDPRSVQRYGPAYRFPQSGWIVLHIEGEPYERGYQHGRLLATEIAAYVRTMANVQSPTAPADGWNLTRQLCNSLFLRRYDKEYLEEMKGIADGATAAGARFQQRPIDLVDIVCLNAVPEWETLPSALEATPTGLEGMRFPHAQPRAMPAPQPMHCSAFAATGPATKDGRAVIGHITMTGLYPALHYNVWIDVKPAQGHRVHMQSYPGGMQSGFDYYLNDAGLVVVETTLRQTKFDIRGEALASRIRKALQYADSIDQAVALLGKDNNGLYTNEWLLADTKTNEIAMYVLGTHQTKLYRSSKNEWFGGTEGFYWGCNNAKDLEVRLETIPSVNDRPSNMVWRPSNRDLCWQRLYHEYKGKIDVEFAKLAFTTPPLASYPSLDAKFTTTDMAKDLKSWALYGPPMGRAWKPSEAEKKLYADIRPLVHNPWTIIHGAAPAKAKDDGLKVVDLSDQSQNESGAAAETARSRRRRPSLNEPAWRGTILPKTDADAWLAAGFADYERLVGTARSAQEDAKESLPTAARERLGLSLFGYRANYLAGARAGQDVPLAKVHAETGNDHWYRLADGKGVCVLHVLRQTLGGNVFEEMMDEFGRANAGKEVTTAQFAQHIEHFMRKKNVSFSPRFFADWLQQTGLPRLRLESGRYQSERDARFFVEGTIGLEGPIAKAPVELQALEGSISTLPVEVVVETAKGEVTKTLTLAGPSTPFRIETKERPTRIIVDKYNLTPKANGGGYSIGSFFPDVEQTLIVYGTRDEEPAQREAAELLQDALRRSASNVTVPVKSDREVSDADLKNHHLLLIGRPDSNSLVERFRSALPIAFGSRSFVVNRSAYAHAGSAVAAAAENPANPRYSIVVIAGLSAEATRNAPTQMLSQGERGGEVLVMPHGGRAQALVIPARELVQELQ
jgi:hypothetical protein